MDLVVVAEKASPQVCRILDYGRLRYEQKRKLKDQKKNQHAQKLKEVKFHVNTDQHDYDYKIKHGIDFLQKGCKLKVSLQFRGRENAHKAIGFEIVENALEALKDYGHADSKPNLSGRIISVTLNPLSTKSSSSKIL